MKQLIVLSVLIVLCGIGYVVFSIMLFQPETIRPIAYEDPAAAVEIQEGEDETETLSSPELEERKNKAVEIILAAVKSYEETSTALPKTASPAYGLFLQLVKRGALPALYPVNYPQNNTGAVEFASLKVNPKAVLDTSGADSDVKCAETTSIFSGEVADDEMTCPAASPNITRMIISGPGNDTIQTGKATTIVDPGTGNDTVQTGPDLSLIFFMSIEGNKTINMDCTAASMEGKKLSADYPLSWVEPYRHFLVFGPQVIEDNLIIKGNTIEDPATNGKITLNGNCFNTVFASSGY